MLKVLDPKGTLPAFLESTDFVPELDLVILGLASVMGQGANKGVEDKMAKCCKTYNNISYKTPSQVFKSRACDDFGMAGMIDPKYFTEDRECLNATLKELNVKDCDRDQFIAEQCDRSKVWSAPFDYTDGDKEGGGGTPSSSTVITTPRITLLRTLGRAFASCTLRSISSSTFPCQKGATWS